MINNPNNTNTTTMGTSQYFFSCFRNCQNSERTRFLLMRTSVHPVVVPLVPVSSRIRRPPGPFVTAPRQRILARHLPDYRHRDEHDPEQDCQQNAGVHVSQRS